MKRVMISLLVGCVGLAGAMGIAQAHRTASQEEEETSSPAVVPQPSSVKGAKAVKGAKPKGQLPHSSGGSVVPQIFLPPEASRPISAGAWGGRDFSSPSRSESLFPRPNPLRPGVVSTGGVEASRDSGNQPTNPLSASGEGGGVAEGSRGNFFPPEGGSPGANSSSSSGNIPGTAGPLPPMLDPFGDRGGLGGASRGNGSHSQGAYGPLIGGAPDPLPQSGLPTSAPPAGAPSPMEVPSSAGQTPSGAPLAGPGPAPTSQPPGGFSPPNNPPAEGKAPLPAVQTPGVLEAPAARPLASAGAGASSEPGLGAAAEPLQSPAQEEGTGQPGSKLLEGPQTAQITIHKLAPPEVQVGRPAKFQIKVVNSGSITATDVEVRDVIPRGARLLRTHPPAQRGVEGELVWKLGSMAPGQEIVLEMELLPTSEGQMGSVATVRYGAEASARTLVTRPLLDIKVSHPEQVVIGESATLNITVSNPGTGVAEGVVLEAHVPEGFEHPAGRELEYEVGVLRPRESRQLELILTAVRPGEYHHKIIGRAEGNLRIETQQSLRVLAPQLELKVVGAQRRYLDREALYQISISNIGSAPAKTVGLWVEVPPGMKFISADNHGYYDPSSRTVSWRLAELPVQTTGTVTLRVLPEELGQKVLRIGCSAERVASVQKEQPVEVEGIVALNFQLVDLVDPVEKQGETTYEIRVVNQGSKAARNVQLEGWLSPQMRVVAAEGPARHVVEEGRIRFEPLAQLAPKAEATFRIRVQCLQPGDLRMRVQLLAEEMERPVVKEESTRVYE